MKIRPVGAESLHVGERTDRETDKRTETTKLIIAFRNFANAPKKVCDHSGLNGKNFLRNSRMPTSEHTSKVQLHASFIPCLMLRLLLRKLYRKESSELI